MAQIRNLETSLALQRKGLRKEQQVLKFLNRFVEWPLAVLLSGVGAVIALWLPDRNFQPWLYGGGAVLFFAFGHSWRLRENTVHQGHLGAGRRGEKRVASLLGRRLCDETLILNDLLIKSGPLTSQIDHLVVAPNGLFVVETKNWSGRITGAEEDDSWIRHRDGRDQKISNPVLQVHRHVRTLRSFLSGAGVDCPDIQALVVGACPAGEFDIKNAKCPVRSPEDAATYIDWFEASRTYSADERERIAALFLEQA